MTRRAIAVCLLAITVIPAMGQRRGRGEVREAEAAPATAAGGSRGGGGRRGGGGTKEPPGGPPSRGLKDVFNERANPGAGKKGKGPGEPPGLRLPGPRFETRPSRPEPPKPEPPKPQPPRPSGPKPPGMG